jgi:hypothetical protein
MIRTSTQTKKLVAFDLDRAGSWSHWLLLEWLFLRGNQDGASGVRRQRVRDASEQRALQNAPTRWPHTINRAEKWSAVSKMALGIPSNDSLIIGEALYSCSRARIAPSSATDLA